jgi:hypothetical protein
MIPRNDQISHIQRNGIETVRHILRQADHRLEGMEKALKQLSVVRCPLSVEHIILHHSLTKDSKTVSWNAIRRYHTQDLGWRAIGYHFGIELIDDHYEILTGRMMGENGAHCREMGMNGKSIGICFLGNFDLIAPCPDQWNLGLKLVRTLMSVFGIPREQISGHREFATYKSCPGALFDLDKFREDLAADLRR